MIPIIKHFEHLKIQLDAIISSTNNFSDDNCIGRGGFGRVYKGELAHSKGRTMVALKRLDSAFGQGNPEFWKEIITLSIYKHENIVSLLGFCDECNEKILVYEYASKKSLDQYLNNDDLTWIRRLKISIGAARGLAYLHNPAGTQQRLLHRDVKSSNILLDDNWNARISDFGLSKFGPANQRYSFLVSGVVGTFGYCDPLYIESGLLTKETDVYSFGVVLFEIFCGRLCIDTSNEKRLPLPGLVQQCFEQNKMNEIIYWSINNELNFNTLKVFSTIAYQCLKRNKEERPLMTDIVRGLEDQERLNDQEAVLSVPRSIILKQEVAISLTGLQNAGKSSLANIIVTGKYSDNINSTEGFFLYTVTKTNVKIKLWDLGGRTQFRSGWEKYCRAVSVIVYVVDAANRDDLKMSKKELDRYVLKKPSLSGIPLLVLGNKMDAAGALSKEALAEQMGLSSIADREVCCLMISCKNSVNIDLVINWISMHPKVNIFREW